MIEVELPYPPSVNNYWRHVGWGTPIAKHRDWGPRPRVLISRRGRAFRKVVRSVLAGLRVQPMTGKLHVRIELHPPDRRRRDVDNALKSLLDALEHGGAYLDDGQIVKLDVEKCQPIAGGKCIVRIEAT